MLEDSCCCATQSQQQNSISYETWWGKKGKVNVAGKDGAGKVFVCMLIRR